MSVPPPNPDLLEAVKRHDVMSRSGGAVMLLLGLAYCAGIVLVVGGFLYGILAGFFDWPVFGLILGRVGPCSLVLLATAVLVLPLLFWEERRKRGDHLVDLEPMNFDNVAEAVRTDVRLQSIAAYDLLMTGPRLVAEAMGQRPGAVKGREALLGRAAVMLRDLAKADPSGGGGGLPLAKLRHGDEPPAAVRAAADYLERGDWIGRSSDGRRYWLGTVGRQRLKGQGDLRRLRGG